MAVLPEIIEAVKEERARCVGITMSYAWMARTAGETALAEEFDELVAALEDPTTTDLPPDHPSNHDFRPTFTPPAPKES